MVDGPRPYSGQPKRHEPDGYSAWTDHSHPESPAKATEPEDILNPDKPSGGASSRPAKPGEKTEIRWFDNEKSSGK